MEGVAVVVGWSALVIAGFTLWQELRTIATAPRKVLARPVRGTEITADQLLPGAALVVGVVAGLHLMAFELPFFSLYGGALPAVPFTDAGTIGAASLVLASLMVGAIVGGRPAQRASFIAAGAIMAYLVPFEVALWAVVVLWAGLGILSTVVARRDPEGGDLFLGAALLLTGAAATVALEGVAPTSRLVVGEAPVEVAVALQSFLALGASRLRWWPSRSTGRPRRWARWSGVLAGASFVYLASIAVVDVAATQVGGSASIEELRTWGQVGLSVLWAVLGLVAFVAGLQRRFPELRQAGLVLLGLATLKVFLVDLAALDVAYRVVSLIALGLLLLAGAGLWQRLQPRPDRAAPTTATPKPDDTPA